MGIEKYDEVPNSSMRKAIAKAESIDPEKEALFLIQDQKDGIRLYHFKSSDENNSLKGLIGL